MGSIILVGTAHVSEKSIAEVNDIIERERPDVVAVELCPARYQALRGEVETKDIPVKTVLKEGKFYYFLVQWLLAYVQRKIGADMGVKPGSEMLAAIDKAGQTGAKVALVDRDIQITLQRFWAHMTFMEKLKMLGALIAASLGIGTKDIDIDTVTNEDVVSELIEELRIFSPSAAKVLIDERDAYIAGNLLSIAPEGKVVAVVGAGHREGILKYIQAPQTIPDRRTLLEVPRKKFGLLNLVEIGLTIMVFGILALLLFYGGVPITTVLTALLFLFLTQGVLSATGVIIARGHPASALTALTLAWFGFLHPFLAIGMIVGLVEARFRPPGPGDFKAISEAESISQMMNNKLFRILLVAALANIGSMLGTFVAVPLLVQYFGIPNPLDILLHAARNALGIIGL